MATVFVAEFVPAAPHLVVAIRESAGDDDDLLLVSVRAATALEAATRDVVGAALSVVGAVKAPDLQPVAAALEHLSNRLSTMAVAFGSQQQHITEEATEALEDSCHSVLGAAQHFGCVRCSRMDRWARVGVQALPERLADRVVRWMGNA